MGALVDVKSRLDEEPVTTLLAYSMFPDPDRIAKTIARYRNEEELELLGYEEDGMLIGIVGIRLHPDKVLELKHIAVAPEERHRGYGRGMLLELLHLKSPKSIVAETDDDAVDFYRSTGFEIASLGEQYPGVERYKCTYEAEQSVEDRM